MAAIDRLQPWRQALAPLTAEMGQALLPWVERLSLALGPLAQVDPEADGDPDGFSGLGRRGSYERLVPTEWLLATEAPDEFVRRAAAGEHAFFQLARRSEAGSRVSAAFFDAGPMQLGAPRLVHLALLLLLERRAQAAGARFFWGVAQRPSTLREAVTPEQAQLLLDGRSRVDLDGPLVGLIRDTRELREAGRELWLVGGPRVRALAPGPFVEVVEPIEREPTRLLARVRRPDRVEVEVSLPLPPAEVQLRLLRDPFVRAAPPPRRRQVEGTQSWQHPRVDGHGALFFSSSGRRLLVELDDGVAAYPIANSPHAAPAGEPMVYQPATGDRLIAACWEKNRATVLLEDIQGALRLQPLGRRGGRSGGSTPVAFDPEGRWSPTTASLLELHPPFANGGPGGHFVADPDGSLVWLGRGPTKVVAQRVSSHVKAVATTQYTVVAAARGEQHVIFVECKADGRDVRLEPTILAEGRVFFGHADVGARHPQLGLCAVERVSEGDWAVYCRQEGASYLPLEAPREGRVVGVCHDGRVPALLVLDDGDMHLLRWGPGGRTTVARTRSPIVSVAVCTERPQLAYLCLDGLLVVLADVYEQPLLQVQHDAR